MKNNVIIIGGGAAGLCAAVAIKRKNSDLSVRLLEALPRVGKKLATTGNGRCNLTNLDLKLKFYPSYAAFTFPFVISAIATKQTMACLANMGQPMPVLQYAVLIETVIAVVLVVYTYIRFMGFIFADNK